MSNHPGGKTHSTQKGDCSLGQNSEQKTSFGQSKRHPLSYQCQVPEERSVQSSVNWRGCRGFAIRKTQLPLPVGDKRRELVQDTGAGGTGKAPKAKAFHLRYLKLYLLSQDHHRDKLSSGDSKFQVKIVKGRGPQDDALRISSVGFCRSKREAGIHLEAKFSMEYILR